MRPLLFIVLLSLLTAGWLQAQTPAWHRLPNAGLEVNQNTSRFEDVYFTNYSTGFAVSLRGFIFKTTNAGSSWQLANDTSGGRRPGFRSVEFLDDGLTGLAGALDNNAPLLRTTDGGQSWTDVSGNVPDTNLSPVQGEDDRRRVCGLAHFGETFYGVGWWGAKQARFFKSTDRGLSWQTTYIDTALASCLVDVVFVSRDTGFAAGGKNGNNFLIPYRPAISVILRTTDGGQSWTQVFSDTSFGGRIWKIQFLGKQLGVGSVEPYYSNKVAMVRTMDGGQSWQLINTGQQAGTTGYRTQGIGFVSPQRGWLGGYYPGLVETSDGGATWAQVDFGANFNRFFVMDGGHVYAGGKEVYRWGDSAHFTTVKVPEAPAELPHQLYPVSPNPARHLAHIAFDLKTTTNVVLQIIGTEARSVQQLENRRLQPGHYEYEWNCEGAPRGNYIVWLGTDEIPLVQRFTVR